MPFLLVAQAPGELPAPKPRLGAFALSERLGPEPELWTFLPELEIYKTYVLLFF